MTSNGNRPPEPTAGHIGGRHDGPICTVPADKIVATCPRCGAGYGAPAPPVCEHAGCRAAHGAVGLVGG